MADVVCTASRHRHGRLGDGEGSQRGEGTIETQRPDDNPASLRDTVGNERRVERGARKKMQQEVSAASREEPLAIIQATAEEFSIYFSTGMSLGTTSSLPRSIHPVRARIFTQPEGVPCGVGSFSSGAR